MLSIDYSLEVPSYPLKVIGRNTMVRGRIANLTLNLSNQGPFELSQLSIKVVVESYVGQQTAQLFSQLSPKIIDAIPPKAMVPLEFKIAPNMPGLISVAIYPKDSSENALMVKRRTETAFQQEPVRYWFHVLESISTDTLIALQALLESFRQGNKK